MCELNKIKRLILMNQQTSQVYCFATKVRHKSLALPVRCITNIA